MQREIEAAGFGGLIHFHWREPIYQPQHRVGETERPDRRERDRSELLAEESGIAGNADRPRHAD